MINSASTKNGSKYLASASMLVLSTLLFSGAANALDRKILSGSICQPAISSQVSDFSYASTGIRNTSAATRTTICPALRDNTFNTNGVNFAGVRVAGTGTFGCYIDNVNNNGTLGRYVYNSRSGTGYISLNLKSTTSQTPYAFECSIPAGGKIVTTVIDEF